jgi:hypothetical protein
MTSIWRFVNSYDKPNFCFSPTINAYEPLTAALGLPFCDRSMPSSRGTSGFFITEGFSSSHAPFRTMKCVTQPHVIGEMNHALGL